MKGSAPRQSAAAYDDTREFERLRGIEREYELETVAEHPRQLIQFQAVSLRVLSGHASRTLRSSRFSPSPGSSRPDGNGMSSIRAIVSGVDHEV